MNSFIVNCFNFSLRPVCYLDNGIKITLSELSSKEILKAAEISDVASITLIGPTLMTKKLKQEIEEASDFSLKVSVILQERI
jgi:hypothetical protein